MFGRITLCLLLAAALSGAYAQSPRIEQARQFDQQTPAVQGASTSSVMALNEVQNTTEDESFGVQQILKRNERSTPFRIFGDATGFYTSNAALTRSHEISDAFLVATFGIEYRRALPYNLQWETTVKLATFRYQDLHELSFESIDAGTGLSYHASRLWDLDFSARYNFTDLIGDESGDSFFKNHTLTLAAQKTLIFSRAHQAYIGVSALFGFSDPKFAQRDEYSAYLGYHVQLTRRLEAETLYRFSCYQYTENSRLDANHTISASVRYAFTKWLTAYASAAWTANRSNRREFDYSVANLGGGVGLSISF